MRSIERRFLELQKRRPAVSSLMNLAGAVKGQSFSEEMIHRWFNKLVEKDDYDRHDKGVLQKHLVALSCAEDNRKQG